MARADDARGVGTALWRRHAQGCAGAADVVLLAAGEELAVQAGKGLWELARAGEGW